MAGDHVLKLCEYLLVPHLWCSWYLNVPNPIIFRWEWVSTWTSKTSSGALLNDAAKISIFAFVFFFFFYPWRSCTTMSWSSTNVT